MLKQLTMTIQDQPPNDNILCKFCCDLESLKKHFYVNHRHCMPCERSFEDDDGIIDHLLKEHNRRVQCEYCPFFNFDPNKLDIHIKSCWNNDDDIEGFEDFEDFEDTDSEQNVEGNLLTSGCEKRKVGLKICQIEAENNGKRKRGRPKGVKNNVRVEEDWTPEKKFKTEHIESKPMIEIKNLENEILSKSLRNKEVLFLAESVDEIEDQTNIADVFGEASEEVDDFDIHDVLLDDKSYSNIDFLTACACKRSNK